MTSVRISSGKYRVRTRESGQRTFTNSISTPRNLGLHVVLNSDFLDQVELGLDQVDMFFLVLQDIFEELAGNIVTGAFAIRNRLAQRRVRVHLELQVGFQTLLHVL